ncbi:MAG: tetratricopeptide repeat protein [Candidatus Pacebacteria bacterium]|nr:tetratricopeptide repeat protein [Candidatus Paceibacterota bacterium]
MTSKQIRLTFFLTLLVFYGSFVLYRMNLPAADDLPRQMKNGEMVLGGDFDVLTKNVYSYVEPDQPFSNHHWLSGVFYYVLQKIVGWNGMTIFKVLLMLVTFCILFKVSLRKADFWLVSILSIPTIFVFIGRAGLRPELFSYFFIALYLYALSDLEDNPQKNLIFWLIPIQLLWTNMHLFCVTGPMIVAGFLFEKIIHNHGSFLKEKLVRKLVVLLLALTLMLAINPFGLQRAFSSFRLNSTEDSPVSSAETVSVPSLLASSPRWSNISVAIYGQMAALLVASFIFALRRKPIFSLKNKPIFYFFASAATAFLGFFVVRSLPLFGLMFLPTVSSNFNEQFVYLKNNISEKWPLSRRAIPAGLIVILFYFMTFGRLTISAYDEITVGITPLSQSSAKFFKNQGLRGPILNDTDIGSYLIYNLYPEEKVFADNRFRDAYSASFFRDVYLPIFNDDSKWRSAFEKYQFNTIILNHYDGVAGLRDFIWKRMQDSDWPLVYADNRVVIFVRNNSGNKDVINKFQITTNNAPQKLNYLTNSDDPDEKTAGADLLAMLGQTDRAMDIYSEIVSDWPQRGKIWLVMGRIMLTRSDRENANSQMALLFFKNAIDNGWATSETYSLLAATHFGLGHLQEAKDAVKQELVLDPDSEDGKKWLEIFADMASKNIK